MLVLAELTPLNASSGARVTLRAASADDRAITGLNSVRWWPALKEVGPLSIRLFDGDFSSAPDVGALSITVLTDKLARLDTNARAYRWAGAGVKIYAGQSGDAWPWTQWLEGKVDGFDAQANQLRLRIKVNTEPFDKDVLTATYAGTGGIEGGADIKNKVKPWLFGRALNVEPVLIDANNSVYQFSGYGPIQAVNVLYERASDFGASFGDYASYTALVAASIPAGRWGTCLASGLVRLGAPAYGVITGDVDGDKPSTWLRKTGEIITRIATNAGVSSGLLDSTSLAALDTAVPYNINLYLDSQTTVLQIAQRLARPCNAQACISWLGKLFVARVAIGTPALTLDAQGRQKPGVIASSESDVSPPYWRVEMGAARSWRVHSFDEIASSAQLLDRGRYDAATTYREGNIVDLEDGSRWEYTATTPTAGNAPILGSAFWSELSPGLGSGAGGALPGQILRDDKFISSFWTVPAPAGRIAWPGSRTDYAVTVPFVASTDLRITYNPSLDTSLPRTTAGKTMYARVLVNPAGFSGVQIIDDDGSPIVDTDGAYIVDAFAADFDLEVAIKWLNADGSFNSRSLLATVLHGGGTQTITGDAPAPVTGYAVLEFGYPSQTGKTGGWTVYEPWLAEYEPTADVTALAQIIVNNPPTVDISADYTGTITAGLPRDVAPTVTRGGADVRTADGTTYVIQNDTGGCAGKVTVNNTTGSANKGVQTISTSFNASGGYDLVVTVDGVTQPPSKVAVNKIVASAPSGGGSSGGGGGTTGASGSFDVTGVTLSSTSLVEIGRVSNLAKSAGQTIRAYFTADYRVYSGGAGRTVSAKWQYSVAGANSWTDFAAVVTGTPAYYNNADYEAVTGSITCNQTAAPSNASYDIRLMALRTGGTEAPTFDAAPASVQIGT
jgi:hypothetical protein